MTRPKRQNKEGAQARGKGREGKGHRDDGHAWFAVVDGCWNSWSELWRRAALAGRLEVKE